MFKVKWTLTYIVAIAATNWAFGYIGVQPIPETDQVWHPLSLIVGFWFVLRDFAHREMGDRYILIPILIGMGLSFALAAPYVAFASAVAFLASELCDTLVYRFTKRPFRDRILLSSLVAVPIDSVAFLGLAFGAAAINPTGLSIMMASKMLGAFVIWMMLRRQIA